MAGSGIERKLNLTLNVWRQKNRTSPVRTGNAPEANDLPVPKDDAELSMDAAACIACGACVAACPNASAMLYVAAKAGHLNVLPQGKAEQYRRATSMIDQMDAEGFGS